MTAFKEKKNMQTSNVKDSTVNLNNFADTVRNLKILNFNTYPHNLNLFTNSSHNTTMNLKF